MHTFVACVLFVVTSIALSAQSLSWSPLRSGLDGGLVDEFIVSPNGSIYADLDYTFARINQSEKQWTDITPLLFRQRMRMAVCPTPFGADLVVVYAGTSQDFDIHFSTNGGNSWGVIPVPEIARGRNFRLFGRSDGTLFGFVEMENNVAVWKSLDFGQSFGTDGSVPKLPEQVLEDSERRLYVMTSTEITMRGGGDSDVWTPLQPPAGTTHWTGAALGGTIAVATELGAFRYEFTTQQWSPVADGYAPATYSTPLRICAAGSHDGDMVVVYDNDGDGRDVVTQKFENGATSWESVGEGQDAIGFRDLIALGSKTLMLSSLAAPLVSSTNGAEWQALGDGLRAISVLRSDVSSSGRIVAPTVLGDVQYSQVSSSEPWQLSDVRVPTTVGITAFEEARHIRDDQWLLITRSGMTFSVNNGESFAASTVPGQPVQPAFPLGVDVAPDGTVFGATPSDYVRSTDGGATWTVVVPSSPQLSVFRSAWSVDGKMYVGTNRGIAVLESSSMPEPIANFGEPVAELWCSPTDPQQVSCITVESQRNFTLRRSNDGGVTWSTLSLGDWTNETLWDVEFDGNGDFYYATADGLYYIKANETDPLLDIIDRDVVVSLRWKAGRGLMATTFRGDVLLADITTSVVNKAAGPSPLSLLTTDDPQRVMVKGLQEGAVTYEVVDITGRTLIRGNSDVVDGMSTVYIGSISGVYLVKFTTQTETSTVLGVVAR